MGPISRHDLGGFRQGLTLEPQHSSIWNCSMFSWKGSYRSRKAEKYPFPKDVDVPITRMCEYVRLQSMGEPMSWMEAVEFFWIIWVGPM